jgi:citrate lyase subunit beta/citryl-CoA lyase
MKPVRSLLYIPANRREWVESAPENAADGYIFDLEDAVPLDEKEHAREVLAEALAAFVDEESAITARINPPDTGLFEADLEAIVRPGLDAVVVPKLPSPTELERTDHVLSYLESVRGIDDRIEIIALPETAQGFRRCYDLCTASERVAAIVGGTSKGADIQRALGFEWTPGGKEKRHMLSKVVMDGRAAGLEQLISGPWHDVEDIKGLQREARIAHQLGYTGYQIIHPSHAEPVNEIFRPDRAEIERCRSLLDAIEDAQSAAGRGAIRHEGEMIDIAHIRRAEDILERARAFDLLD